MYNERERGGDTWKGGIFHCKHRGVSVVRDKLREGGIGYTKERGKKDSVRLSTPSCSSTRKIGGHGYKKGVTRGELDTKVPLEGREKDRESTEIE